MNFFSPSVPRQFFRKFRYRFHASTLIQKNVASKKYCISAAVNRQPMFGFTRSILVKNVISSASKEEERHMIILDESFLRRSLKRKISIALYTATNSFTYEN